MLDDRTGSSKPVPAHIGTISWMTKYNRMGRSALLGREAGSADVPEGAVPARLKDLSGLPAALIWIGSIDLFVDENLDYACRLVGAGVPTELHPVPCVYHVLRRSAGILGDALLQGGTHPVPGKSIRYHASSLVYGIHHADEMMPRPRALPALYRLAFFCISHCCGIQIGWVGRSATATACPNRAGR